MQRQLTVLIDDWDKDVAKLARLLDPAFKTGYMNEYDAAAARDLLRRTVDRYRANPAPPTTTTILQPEISRAAHTSLSIRERRLKAVSSSASGSDVDEVGEYLATATSDMPILDYWSHNSTRFPNLTRLACDVLAAQASSVQAERENSKAKYVITDVRNRLSAPAVQASLCLKSWLPVLDKLGEFEEFTDDV